MDNHSSPWRISLTDLAPPLSNPGSSKYNTLLQTATLNSRVYLWNEAYILLLRLWRKHNKDWKKNDYSRRSWRKRRVSIISILKISEKIPYFAMYNAHFFAQIFEGKNEDARYTCIQWLRTIGIIIPCIMYTMCGGTLYMANYGSCFFGII